MKLKVGDRVICTAVFESNTSTVGKHGTIIEEYGGYLFIVQFDEDIGGHAGNALGGKKGHCWSIPNEGYLSRVATTKHDGSRLIFNFVVHG
jgi:hypothetical protein